MDVLFTQADPDEGPAFLRFRRMGFGSPDEFSFT